MIPPINECVRLLTTGRHRVLHGSAGIGHMAFALPLALPLALAFGLGRAIA